MKGMHHRSRRHCPTSGGQTLRRQMPTEDTPGRTCVTVTLKSVGAAILQAQQRVQVEGLEFSRFGERHVHNVPASTASAAGADGRPGSERENRGAGRC